MKTSEKEELAVLIYQTSVMFSLVLMPISLIYVHAYVLPVPLMGRIALLVLAVSAIWLAKTDKPMRPLVLCTVIWGIVDIWIAASVPQRLMEFPQAALALAGGELVLIVAFFVWRNKSM